ncbi:MAG TPA: flagellar biosynthetic protein FliQ [Haliangiales bacterium]|nr:flagellar biosynthetic protein FliQ [Haliangiales bacterium]
MTGEILIRLARESLFLALALAAPVVLATLVVAVAVGVLQAATQVQDATVGFAPRAAAVTVALVVTAPWIGAELVRFAQVVLDLIPRVT